MCRAISASKEPEKRADDLVAPAPVEDEVLPDILVVEDDPDREQIKQPAREYDQTDDDTVLALIVDDAAADSAAVFSPEATHKSSMEDVLAEESPVRYPSQHAAQLALEADHADGGTQVLTDDTWTAAADDYEDADEQDAAAEPTDAIAAEIAAVTDELLVMAIYEKPAVTAQLPQAGEDAMGAALEATIEGLVSTTEAAKPGRLRAKDLQADAEHVTAEGLEIAEEAGDTEVDSVVTDYEGIPVLSVLRPHAPDTASVGPKEVQNPSTDASAAEQQALANTILSGEATASRLDSPASELDTEFPSLLHHEVPADSNMATLDSLIGSRYQAKEFSGAQGSENEEPSNAALSMVPAQLTGGDSESADRAFATDASTVASELQLAVQEEASSMDSAGYPTEQQQGDIAEATQEMVHVMHPAGGPTEEQQEALAGATTLQARNLAPAIDTEDAASPYTAADTEDQEDSMTKATILEARYLAPAGANDTEVAASSYAAADTEHDATPHRAALQDSSREDAPSEAANADVLNSVLVNLTLVSSGDAALAADEAER